MQKGRPTVNNRFYTDEDSHLSVEAESPNQPPAMLTRQRMRQAIKERYRFLTDHESESQMPSSPPKQNASSFEQAKWAKKGGPASQGQQKEQMNQTLNKAKDFIASMRMRLGKNQTHPPDQ